MPKPLSKAKAVSNVFSLLFAFKEGSGRPWKHLEDSMDISFTGDLPLHIAEAQFKHLWETDEVFQEKTLSWLSNTSIEMMDTVKTLNFSSPKKKEKPILLSNKQTGDRRSNGIQSALLDALSNNKGPFKTADLSSIIFKTTNPTSEQNKKTYMGLYFLMQKGVVEKSKKDNEVIWTFLGHVPISAKNVKVRYVKKRKVSPDAKERNEEIRDYITKMITKSGPFTIPDMRKKLHENGKLSGQDKSEEYRLIFKHLKNLHESGKVTKTTEGTGIDKKVIYQPV